MCKLSRYSRNKNIEIRRVAECENGYTFAIVATIVETIKEPIPKLDVKEYRSATLITATLSSSLNTCKSGMGCERRRKYGPKNEDSELHNTEPINTNEHLCISNIPSHLRWR